MNPGSSYNPTTDFSLLLVGQPLSGKTTLALQFPSPYIITGDRKLQNAASRLPAGTPWWYDYIDEDEKGKVIAEDDRWTRITELVKTNGSKPEVKTIIFDPLSAFQTALQSHILARGGSKLTVGGERVFEQQHWQPFAILMTRLIAVTKSLGKYFIVCIHEMTEEDAVLGTQFYKPQISGQLKNTLGGLFTNVWRTEVEQTGRDKHRYMVRTRPMPRMMLGNSLGLPTEFDFTFDEISKRLSGAILK